MGNLIVHNGSSLPIIVEVKKNGQTVAKVSGIKIPNGGYSKPIPLEKGVYEVTATSKLSNGKTATETKQVTITDDEDTQCAFFQVPSEKEECIPPNLISNKQPQR